MRLSTQRLQSVIAIAIIVVAFSADQIGASIIDSVRLFDSTVEVDVPPRLITKYLPAAPYVKEMEDGPMSIWLKVLVSKRGWVKQAALITSSHIDIINTWATEAAYKNKFVPVTTNRETMETWVTYRLVFQTRDPSKIGVWLIDQTIGPVLPRQLQTTPKRNFAIPTLLPRTDFPAQAKNLILYSINVVWVKVLVETDGKPKKAEIVHSDIEGYGFEKEALRSTMASRFLPWKRRKRALPHSFYHSVIFVTPEDKMLKDFEDGKLFDLDGPAIPSKSKY